MKSVHDRLSRRELFAGAAVAAGAMAATVAPRPAAAQGRSIAASTIADLTHDLPEDFPTFFGVPGLAIEKMFSFDPDGFNVSRWTVVEHTGTHVDAPIHFSADGQAVNEIPAENLVAPLVVIDIAERAQDDADTQVTPDDVSAWIAANGDIPDGACVAMHSGWDKLVNDPKFRNADGEGAMHFPGFHVEATKMLMEQANVVGMAVDTLSLDHGISKDFATHYAWLPTNRWGIENIANLSNLPATGATIVVGAPKIVGASGGPARIFAMH